MSKYEPLWLFLKEKNQEKYKLTYKEIENILGFPIDHSFLKYKKEVREYGYEVEHISLKEQWVSFARKKD